MCGACGAGSARAATHWASPFLASVPARAAAARTLTRWGRGAGWTGVVNGVASGFEVVTSSGRRTLTPDLGSTVERLDASGISRARLLDASDGVVEGPPTRPAARPHSQVATSFPAAAAGAGADPGADPGAGAGADGRVLPAAPRRWYRVPGVLAWLVVAQQSRALGRTTMHLSLPPSLGGPGGILFTSGGAGGVTCEVAPAPEHDVLTCSDRAVASRLVGLLCAGLSGSVPG